MFIEAYGLVLGWYCNCCRVWIFIWIVCNLAYVGFFFELLFLRCSDVRFGFEFWLWEVDWSCLGGVFLSRCRVCGFVVVIEEERLIGGGGFGVFMELRRVIGVFVCLDIGIFISSEMMLYKFYIDKYVLKVCFYRIWLYVNIIEY